MNSKILLVVWLFCVSSSNCTNIKFRKFRVNWIVLKGSKRSYSKTAVKELKQDVAESPLPQQSKQIIVCQLRKTVLLF